MDCNRHYEIRCNDRELSRRHGARSASDRKIAITFSTWIIYSSWSYLPHVCVTQARVNIRSSEIIYTIAYERNILCSYYTCIFSNRDPSIFKTTSLDFLLSNYLGKNYVHQRIKNILHLWGILNIKSATNAKNGILFIINYYCLLFIDSATLLHAYICEQVSERSCVCSFEGVPDRALNSAYLALVSRHSSNVVLESTDSGRPHAHV